MRTTMGTTERESMLQLAAEAFHSRNFDLAADIYQCQLATHGDRGDRLELLLKQADSLAFGGKLAEAFDVYRQAAEIERLRPVHLVRLVEYLSRSIRRQDWEGAEVVVEEEAEERSRDPAGGGKEVQVAGAGAGNLDLSCPICQSFLFEPVTLPCGHCFCKTCLEKEKEEKERPSVVCRVCRGSSTLLRRYRVNVVLSCLLAKWFPSPHQAGRLRREGNGLYAEKRTEEALEKYDRAISIGTMLYWTLVSVLGSVCLGWCEGTQLCVVLSVLVLFNSKRKAETFRNIYQMYSILFLFFYDGYWGSLR